MTTTIGTTICTKDGRIGTITSIKGRWLTVVGPDGEFKVSKGSVVEQEVTADKDAIALAASAPLVMTNEELANETAPTTNEPVLVCPKCQYRNTIAEAKVGKAAYQCKECGTWLQVRIPADRSHYVRGLGETAGGNDSFDIGDETADLLRGKNEVDCIATAAVILSSNQVLWTKGFAKQVKEAGANTDVGGIAEFLGNRFAARNSGMIRMNCGNLIRGILKKIANEQR